MNSNPTPQPCLCGNGSIVWLKWAASAGVTESCTHTVERFKVLYGNPTRFTVLTEKPE